MPHLTLEYSANVNQAVNFKDLFAKLHAVLNDTGGIRIENCKSRAAQQPNFYIADGDAKHAFVHLGVRFLEGRAQGQKQNIGAELLNVLKRTYAPSLDRFELQISVEIEDIERAMYFKIPKI